MPTNAPRKGCRYDSTLRPVWSSPVAQSFSPPLGSVSHRLAGQSSPSRPAILFDTKKNLTRSSTFYSLPDVNLYKQERGGNRGTSFGPHPKSPMRPRFPDRRDITRDAFLSYEHLSPLEKYRRSKGGESGTTFGPGLNKRVKDRNLTPVNLLTSNAYLNYGASATSGSDRFPHSGSAVFGQPARSYSGGGSLTASWRSTATAPGKRAHSPSFGHSASSPSLSHVGDDEPMTPSSPDPEMMAQEPLPMIEAGKPSDLISPSPE